MAETIAELREQRRKLDARIAELETDGDEDLTPARIRREFTPEEAARELGRRLQAEPPSYALNRGYERSDPKALREQRQEGRGARRGLEGGGGDA